MSVHVIFWVKISFWLAHFHSLLSWWRKNTIAEQNYFFLFLLIWFYLCFYQFENSSLRHMFFGFWTYVLRQIFVLSVWTQFLETYVDQMSFEELSWNWYWLCRLPPLSLLYYDQNTNVFLQKSFLSFFVWFRDERSRFYMNCAKLFYLSRKLKIAMEYENGNVATEKDGKEIWWWNSFETWNM